MRSSRGCGTRAPPWSASREPAATRGRSSTGRATSWESWYGRTWLSVPWTLRTSRSGARGCVPRWVPWRPGWPRTPPRRCSPAARRSSRRRCSRGGPPSSGLRRCWCGTSPQRWGRWGRTWSSYRPHRARTLTWTRRATPRRPPGSGRTGSGSRPCPLPAGGRAAGRRRAGPPPEPRWSLPRARRAGQRPRTGPVRRAGRGQRWQLRRTARIASRLHGRRRRRNVRRAPRWTRRTVSATTSAWGRTGVRSRTP